MKYFAKYLPVEGEIKEGDFCSLKEMEGWTKILPFEKTIGKTYIEIKKYKLFLCSRDIQVGDRVYNIVSHTTFVVEKIDDSTGEVYYLAHEVLSPARNTIKVLGEISPEATWVKEGDEFEESEVKPSYAYKGRTENNLLVKEVIFYRILGPCDHFH